MSESALITSARNSKLNRREPSLDQDLGEPSERELKKSVGWRGELTVDHENVALIACESSPALIGVGLLPGNVVANINRHSQEVVEFDYLINSVKEENDINTLRVFANLQNAREMLDGDFFQQDSSISSEQSGKNSAKLDEKQVHKKRRSERKKSEHKSKELNQTEEQVSNKNVETSEKEGSRPQLNRRSSRARVGTSIKPIKPIPTEEQVSNKKPETSEKDGSRPRLSHRSSKAKLGASIKPEKPIEISEHIETNLSKFSPTDVDRKDKSLNDTGKHRQHKAKKKDDTNVSIRSTNDKK